jgi:drug/metabolite transporter (DMT)-like permease
MASILLATVGLGVAPLAKKAALTNGAAPLPLAFSTVLIAAVIGLAVLLAEGGVGALRPQRPRAYMHIAVVGVLGSGAVALLAVTAMTGTTATQRGLFQSMYPVATAIAARLLLNERLRLSAYAVIAIMTLGLVAMNTKGSMPRLGTPFWLLTLTLPLIGLSDVYARKTLKDTDAGFVTVGRLLAGTFALSFALLWVDGDQWAVLFESKAWVTVAGTAMAAGLLGLYRAMNTTGASLAAAFAAMAPVVTLTTEWWILGTSFRPVQLAGLVLVIAGAIVLALGAQRFKKVAVDGDFG